MRKSVVNISVRKAAAGDYPAVLSIMNQVQNLHVEWRPDIYKATDVTLPEEYFNSKIESDEFYVAESEGKIVGVLGLVYRHIENPAQVTRDVVFIDSMAVDEPFRGQGVGHAFFEALKEIAKEKHCDGIELQVNARNRQAYEMYMKYGFTEKSINMELLNWK